MQTLFAKLVGQEFAISADRVHRVKVDLGDEIVLEFNSAANPQTPKKLVVLFHGLGGCSESAYMLRLCRKFNAKGVDVVRVNHRGSGYHVANCKGIYHSGSVDDVYQALNFLSAEYPEHQIHAVAFSLSGTILLNTLGTHVDACDRMLEQAITISAPSDLESSSKALTKNSNWNYNIFYTHYLKKHANMRREKYPELKYPDVSKVRNLRDFDQVFTAKVGGFKDRSDYYQTWSPKDRTEKIKTRTVILGSANDPIVPVDTFSNLKLSSSTTMTVEKCGGHMGFIGRGQSEFNDNRWMDSFIMSHVLKA